MPEHENPADFLMDVISGQVCKTGKSADRNGLPMRTLLDIMAY
jgi:hypothetical protein